MCSRPFQEELKKSVSGSLIFEAPLDKHTSWKVGGPAEVLFIPSSVEDLAKGIAIACKDNIPVTVLGNGTNVLVSDSGIRGLTVKLKALRNIEVTGQRITAGAGVELPELSRIARQHSLSGLEFGIGIPASLGGAVVSNAGAHGSCMQDIVTSVKTMDQQGKVHTFSRQEICFGYRSSWFQSQEMIVLEAVMELKSLPESEIQDKMQHFLEIRRKTQPTGCATAGSVFVNPPSAPAGYYIEAAGLKGVREGGAQVSMKHANFFVNADHATAGDILRLIRRVQKTVYSMFHVQLETEIKLLGGEP